jgi:hypothetical protein
MRKIGLALLLSFTLLGACGASDNASQGQQIVGTWSITEIKGEGSYQPGSMGVVIGPAGKYFAYFKSGATCNSGGTYTYQGGVLTMTPSHNNDALHFGGTPVFGGADAMTVEVRALDGTSLVVFPGSTAKRIASPTYEQMVPVCQTCLADPTGTDCDT